MYYMKKNSWISDFNLSSNTIDFTWIIPYYIVPGITRAQTVTSVTFKNQKQPQETLSKDETRKRMMSWRKTTRLRSDHSRWILCAFCQKYLKKIEIKPFIQFHEETLAAWGIFLNILWTLEPNYLITYFRWLFWNLNTYSQKINTFLQF